jgi:hypothetical protein
MAATGLLGINPYFKGVKIDTSKPVNFAIQLQQKEQAKKEALDKSFMDYEKSINPAGMRKQEGDIFLQKFAENKAFYLQNRDKILNPARYGYDAQSQYMANNKGLLSLIDQSKQAAANDKIVQQHFVAQKDLNAPEGYKTDLELSRLPVTDPNYKPLDITRHRFYENLDPIKYANKVYSKIKLSEEAPEFIEMKEKPGYYYTKTKSKVLPEYKNIILQEGYTNYANDEGLRKGINEIFDTNKAEVKRLEEKYSTKIPNAQALAGIYTWDMQPMKEVTSDIKPTKDLEFQNWLKKFNLTQGAKGGQKGEYSPQVQVDEIFEAGEGDKIEINVEGKNIKGRRVQLPADIEGKFDRKVGNTKFSPDYFVMSEDKLNIYPVFVTGKTKYGSDILGGEGGTKLNEKIPVKTSLIPALGKAYGGQSWTKENLFSDGTQKAPPKSDGKKTKTYKGLDKNGNPIYE